MVNNGGFTVVQERTTKDEGKVCKKVFVIVCLVLTLVLSLTIVSGCEASRKIELAETAALQIIRNTLRSPSTAVWREVKYLENNEKGQYVVYVECDAQNGLGVYIRGRYFVIVFDIDIANETFKYSRSFSHIECSGENDTAKLALIKALNGYNDSGSGDDTNTNQDPPPKDDNSVNIVFVNDGIKIDTQNVKKGETITTPPTVTKENYNFLGWYNGTQKVEFPLKADSDMTVTAKWEGTDCRYTLQENDNVFTIKYGEKQNIKPPESKYGYIFVGWYYNDTQITNADGEMLNEWSYSSPIELYPKYDLVEYHAKYNVGANGMLKTPGMSQGKSSLEFTCDITGSFTVPKVTAEGDRGYKFVKWSDGQTSPTRQDTNITGDITITAEFIRYWTFTFVVGEGGTIEGETVQEVTGSNTSAVTAVADEGYTFSHWEFTKRGITYEIKTSELIINTKEWEEFYELEYTAVFEKKVYTVKYMVAVTDGYCHGTIKTLTGSQGQKLYLTCDIDNNYTVPEVTAEAERGYKFVKWSDGQTSPTRQDTNITGDITITAEFIRYWTFTFVAGEGGTIEGETVQEVTGANSTLVTAVADEGYTFDHWEFTKRGITYEIKTSELIVNTKEWEEFYELEYTAVFTKVQN